MVMGTALMVTVVGLAALTAVRVARRTATAGNDFIEARLHAQSAIEIGLALIDADPDWRIHTTNGVWFTDRPLGTGSLTLSVIDPLDGDLANSASDPVVLSGLGKVRDARYALAVQLQPYGPKGMDCLASAVHAGERIYNYGTVTADAAVSADVNVINWYVLRANVEAAGTVYNYGTITGTSTSGVAAKEMPDTTKLFTTYAAMATVIPRATLEGGNKFKQTLLSPAYNPYTGVTNANGVYLVDCQGQNIEIHDMRIVGTLVLRNAGSDTKVVHGVLWEPAVPNYPALIVEGPIKFDYETQLSESHVNLNLNPSHTPYKGASDTDKTDIYASKLTGIYYATGLCTLNATVVIEGVLISNYRVQVNGTLTVTHDATLRESPPPGFETAYRPLAIQPGTWIQLVN
ncbi:MAG TPA: hypothetical protein PKK06_10960 [Phycisphaerae bacterium]|nr:hypothetical protein [Phycisphaerae bacterium]HNU44335.1 hypothetical protein [Phycisphaerae bacterium]